MKTYKYFSSSDLNEEQIGKVKAKNLKEAYIKASYKKNLNLNDFKILFDIKEINER